MVNIWTDLKTSGITPLIIYRPIEPYLNSLGLRVEHGLISKLAKKTGLSRNTVKNYLRGQTVGHLNLDNLSNLTAELVGIFPALDAVSLLSHCVVWSTLKTRLAESTTLTTYVGAVSHEPFEWPLDAKSADVSVSPNDTSVADALEAASMAESTRVLVPFQRDAATRKEKIEEADKDYVRQLFKDRAETNRSIQNHTDLFLATSKVNLASEVFVAGTLKLVPFETNASERLPFGYVPRKTDLKKSCFVVSGSGLDPGLVWRTQDSTWTHLGFAQDDTGVTHDAGIVYVRYNPTSLLTELVAFGFSGFGTRSLGDTLVSNRQIPWPPKTRHGSDFVDVFAYKFVRRDDQLEVEGPERMPSRLLASYL